MHGGYKRLLIWGGISIFVLVGIGIALWPRAQLVDITAVEVGSMMNAVEDEGKTRILDVFVVSAPVNGQLRRVELEPGDSVEMGQTIVAEIEPAGAALLDPRTSAEAEAQLKAAESAEALAQSGLEKARAELSFAESELARSRELAANGTISQRDLEAAERAFDTSRATLGVAHAEMQIRSFELAQAQAHLMTPSQMVKERELCECISISAPVSGQVLQVHRESAGPVAAGEPLIKIGNPNRLEVVVDLLSVDAVKVSPGDRALIKNWGGQNPLDARVKRVEPFGFTKVSALGIEEQRVNVVLDITSPKPEWRALGHGYQVDVAIVLWEATDATKIPLTALFRSGDDWAVFARTDGRAQKRIVSVGQTNGREAEILSGLHNSEEIVVYPGDSLIEGQKIAAR